MSAPDAIMSEEDIEASKKLLKTSRGSIDSEGCTIDAKPPESIKHLISKDECTTTK